MKLSYTAWRCFKKWWTIINIASIAAFMTAWNPMYTWTKAFIRTFSLNLNEQLKKKWIYVQTLCPWCLDTNLRAISTWKTPKLWAITVKKAVSISLKAAKNKKVQCIPWFINKIIVFWTHLIPRKFIYKFSRGILWK